jgi:hypothetical protein
VQTLEQRPQLVEHVEVGMGLLDTDALRHHLRISRNALIVCRQNASTNSSCRGAARR